MVPTTILSSVRLASPRRIIISEKEYSTGTTSLDTVQAGVEDFQTHGFIILENAINTKIIGKLRTQMLKDTATCLTFPDLMYNHGNEKNNFSVTPPLSDEFLFEDIWANKHATDIMQQIIGPTPILCWASSNVLIKTGEEARQAVHSDAYTDIPSFPFCVEMNIYLQDTNRENGSTEIWPGTHVYTNEAHLPHARGWIKKKAFTDQALKSPPIQPTIPAGSILMRDLRLWHSGMTNTSQTPRIIIALLYFPQWFRPLMRLKLPYSVRPKAEAWRNIDLLSNTDFVDGPIDHLRTHFPMNFTQDPAKELMKYRIAIDKAQGREPGAHILVTNDNYWTPLRPKTRAAKKRALEDEQSDWKEKKIKNQETDHIPLVRQEIQTKNHAKKVLQSENDPQMTVKIEANDGAFESQISSLITKPCLKYERQVTGTPKVEQGSRQDKNLLNSLPDYKDSPMAHAPLTSTQPREHNHKLEADLRAKETHLLRLCSFLTDPKTGKIQQSRMETLKDAWIATLQKKVFKPGFAPTQGPGPQISPQFSPKSKTGMGRSYHNSWMQAMLSHCNEEEWLERHYRQGQGQGTRRGIQSRQQNQQEPHQYPLIPDAKMLPSPGQFIPPTAAPAAEPLSPSSLLGLPPMIFRSITSAPTATAMATAQAISAPESASKNGLPPDGEEFSETEISDGQSNEGKEREGNNCLEMELEMGLEEELGKELEMEFERELEKEKRIQMQMEQDMDDIYDA